MTPISYDIFELFRVMDICLPTLASYVLDKSGYFEWRYQTLKETHILWEPFLSFLKDRKKSSN